MDGAWTEIIYLHQTVMYITTCTYWTEALKKTYILKTVEILSKMCYFILIENSS